MREHGCVHVPRVCEGVHMLCVRLCACATCVCTCCVEGCVYTMCECVHVLSLTVIEVVYVQELCVCTCSV